MYISKLKTDYTICVEQVPPVPAPVVELNVINTFM